MARLIGYKFVVNIYDLAFVKSQAFFTDEPIPVEIMEGIVTDYVRDVLSKVNDDFETAFGINEIKRFRIIAAEKEEAELYIATFAFDNTGAIQVEISAKNNSRFLEV